MALADKIIMFLCLFSGFFWLHGRARKMNLETQIDRAVIGVFVLLPAILIGDKYFFEHWHFGPYTDLLLKVLVAAAAFLSIGHGCIRTGEPESMEGPAEAGGAESCGSDSHDPT